MNVVLGIGGGIAAYKAAELARALIERGASVQVVMTRAAQEFVRPLTFAALTARKVITDLFAQTGEDTLASAVEHIRVAQENDVLAVAPATADLLGKFAHGLADDFLTTTYLAFTGPVVLAPAMNTNMWQHPATRANLEILRSRGHIIVDPEDGFLACGMVGPGRLADPLRIAAAVLVALPARRDLAGETVLVTAGPTQEPIDPVRVLTNVSSGKMGYAVARAAKEAGAEVTLISGPVALATPPGVARIDVRTAEEMFEAVRKAVKASDVFISVAAVADYRVKNRAAQKIKKSGAGLALDLEENPDILSWVAAQPRPPFCVGFAAESEKLAQHAKDKRLKKGVPLMAANLAQEALGAEENSITLYDERGEHPLGRGPKLELARKLLEHVAGMLPARK
jgi:phosphopantothenoylcysteine decarboxylase/phosphopantothenate--cysteine ligase